jgi:hypothetical protein
MADTIQVVTWSLEQRCPLRKEGAHVQEEDDALDKARAYSSGLHTGRHEFGVFGDIYVSSLICGEKPSGKSSVAWSSYPADGFVISDAFREFGGTEALVEMCAKCPANTLQHELAGCFGSLYQRPEAGETEVQLQGIASRFGLEAELGRAFPTTTPRWYGLWAISPVPRTSRELLRTLVSEMSTDEASGKMDKRQARDFARLVKAIDRAMNHNLRLHVSLLPPGHTDFGIYTVFPHCPFCKAAARIERWRKYPTARQKCRVCGTEFSPAETAKKKLMKEGRDPLREILGEERFRKFAREYLIVQGRSAEDADAIVFETEAKEKWRQEKRRRENEIRLLKDKYIHDQVFAGLDTVAPPPSEFEDTEEEKSQLNAGTWFDALNFAEAIRRALAGGISIASIMHRSASGESDKYECVPDSIRDPLGVLEQWKKDGCSEKFAAHFRVDDTVVRPIGKAE